MCQPVVQENRFVALTSSTQSNVEDSIAMVYIDITPSARVDIALAYALCPVEISGIGEVENTGNSYRISEVILFPQECYLEHTTFDREAFGRYAHNLNQKRVTTRSPSGMNTKRLWWHSHVWGKARFSSIDIDYIEQFGADTLLPFNPYLISIVGNKQGHLTTCLTIFKPERTWECVRELPLSDASFTRAMLYDLYRERMPRMHKLISDMVTIKPLPLYKKVERDKLSSREKK